MPEKTLFLAVVLSAMSLCPLFAQSFSMGGMSVSNGASQVPVNPIKSQVNSNPYYREIIKGCERTKSDNLAKTLASLKSNPELLEAQLNSPTLMSPLYYAINANKPDNVALLLKYGANPNHAITIKEYRAFTKEVTSVFIDKNKVDEYGYTPLSFACSRVSVSSSDRKATRAIIELLLKNGADCNAVVRDEESDDDDKSSKKSKKDERKESKPPALILAEREMLDELQLLIDSGNLDFKSPNLLDYLESNKNDKGAKLLIAARANAKQRKDKADTAASLKPAYSGHPELTFDQAVANKNKEELIKYMGILDSLDKPLPDNKLDQTPLIRAAYLNSPFAVELLLKYGASCEPEDTLFCNALAYAKMNDCQPVIELLEAAGAKMPDCVTLEQAVRQNRPDMIEKIVLEERKKTMYLAPLLNKNLTLAVSLKRIKAFSKLIEMGGNLNQLVVNKNIPIVFAFIDLGYADFLAASQGHSYQLDLRVKHPVRKLPPLSYALETSKPNQVEVVKTLIKLGADLNLTATAAKKTPLMFAAESGNQELVNLLISAGANPGLKDADGKTYQSYMKKAADTITTSTQKKTTSGKTTSSSSKNTKSTSSASADKSVVSVIDLNSISVKESDKAGQ